MDRGTFAHKIHFSGLEKVKYLEKIILESFEKIC